MAAGNYNFTIEQGATFTRTLKYKDSSGNPINLSDYAIRMQIREKISSTTSIISLTESSTSGGSIISVINTGDGNSFTIKISATDTAAMSFDTAAYDLEIERDNNVTRLLQGRVKLSKEVTRD
jgi:hypothetical protein